MSRLSEFLKNKPKAKSLPVENEQQSQRLYNRIWLNRTSNATGFIISSDDKKVDGILDALNRKDGHCPCGGTGKQFLCPCVVMREKGICKCGLYENIVPVSPKGSSGGRIKINE